MGFLDASTVEWWLPATYLLLAGIAEVTWKSRAGGRGRDAKPSEETAESNNGSLLAPLIHEGKRHKTVQGCTPSGLMLSLLLQGCMLSCTLCVEFLVRMSRGKSWS